MKRCLILLVVVLLGVAPHGAAANRSLDTIVPADAGLVLLLRDAPGTLESWGSSPLSALWKDPQMQRFFGPLREQIEAEDLDGKLREETGHTLSELVEMVEGDVLLYVPGFPEALLAGGDAEDGADAPDLFVVAAAVGEHAPMLEEIVLRHEREEAEAGEAEDVERIVRTYRDVQLHVERSLAIEDAPEAFTWAIADGVLVLAGTPERAQDVVDTLIDGPDGEAIGATAGWTAMARRTGAADVLAYVNLERLVPVVREALDAAAEGAEAAALPFQPQAVLSALGLESLDGAYLAAWMEGARTDLELGIAGATDRGLLRLAAYGPGPAPRATIIPADAAAFGTARFDPKRFWGAVESIANAINPGLLAMAGAQLQLALGAQQLELDLERDLLESLGDEMVWVQTLETGGTASLGGLPVQTGVLGLGITRRQGVELTLDVLKQLAGKGSELFTTRDYLGTTIYSAGGDPGEDGAEAFHYAVLDDWLLLAFGPPAGLEAVLVAASRPTSSVWERPDVKAALAELPPGAVGLSFQDGAETLHTMLATFAALGTADTELAEDAEELPIDAEALPEKAAIARHVGPVVAGLYHAPDGFFYRIRLLPGGATAR